jgi:anti-sigma regulatory factor (Ser/Thr protein kinase)
VVTELVTNAWQVGAPSIEVWCWRDGGELGIQVDDDGPGLRDPLAGYRRPKKAVTGGRGLWIARQMADILEIASSERGTSVRARFFESWGHGMSADRSCDA